MDEKKNLRVLDIINCSSNDCSDADIKICDLFEKNKTPTNTDVASANYFFSTTLNELYTMLNNFEGEEKKMCEFLINRANECKNLLSYYYHKITNHYYISAKPDDRPIPNLEERRRFPQLEDHSGPLATSDFKKITQISRRIQRFLIRIYRLLHPDKPFFVIKYYTLKITTKKVLDFTDIIDLITKTNANVIGLKNVDITKT